MNYLGFASPFTMSSSQFDDEAVYTDESLSPSSSQSSASYISFDAIPLPPTEEDDSPASTPADEISAAQQGFASPVAPAEELLPPLSPPANSFASAQAAMAAQNSSHSQNLIGHCLDNSSVGFASTLEFISILGLGAYGVVYLARDVAARPSAFPSSRAHPQLGNQPLYAVKCLNKVGLDVRQRNFQQREIALHSAASQHGNVVTLYNVIEEETCIYVVLQFCEEGDLFGMITERQRYLGDDELIRDVFLQIVDAVEYCHEGSIYHRDLKPENILCLEGGKKVVLADFGLATHEKTSGDFGCGSTFYMSPECQGGLFQRLASYSTPHNDIWSLGVILVNLTCGRNPWKQACPSDETFCAYLGNPDFLRSILPISDHTNRILKRIFALNPAMRISLKDLRREILSVKTFVMSEDELKHATRATKEAARAFAQAAPEERRCEKEVIAAPQPVDEDILLISPCASQNYEDDNESTPSPNTPTPQHRQTETAPITPPATPRRLNRPAPPALKPSNLKSTYSSDGSMSQSGSEGSSDTLASDEDINATPRRRRRQDVYSTPPQQTRHVFHADDHRPGSDGALPPSPVTPSSHRRPRAAATRSGSPRAATRPPSGRRRKTSIDSSSSSSGNSSQPPTPTGPPPHYGHSSTSALDYGLATHVRIVDSSDQEMTFANSGHGDDRPHLRAAKPIVAEVQQPQIHTAYYPLFADWNDAASDQQSHYSVTLPPPVFLPAVQDGDEGIFDFPLPPSTGYYHREPAQAGQIPMVDVQVQEA